MAHPMVVTKAPKSVTALNKLNEADGLESGLAEYSTQELYRELIGRFGEDPQRDGLLATPGRVEKSMAFLTKGYDQDPTEILRGAV